MKGFFHSLANALVSITILLVVAIEVGSEFAVLLGLAMIYGEAATARANSQKVNEMHVKVNREAAVTTSDPNVVVHGGDKAP